MSTINDRKTVDRLIAQNGHYEADWKNDPGADPPVLSITQYTNQWGGTSYGLVYPINPPGTYAETEYVIAPTVLFEHQPHSDCNDPMGREASL